MPSEASHAAQAQHNEALADALAPIDALNAGDWVITLRFYAGLHYVRAYLASHGYRREYKYEDIKRMLRQLGASLEVREAFHDFLDLSAEYRYRCVWPSVRGDDSAAAVELLTILKGLYQTDVTTNG